MPAYHSTTTAPVAGNRTAAEIDADLASIEDGFVAPQADPVPPPVDSTEDRAAKKGWVPKDQYKGEPSKWVDASTFLDRGEKFNHNLQREVERLKAQIQSFEGTKAAFKQFHEETLAAKDAELQAAITQLRVERSQAIRDGDDEGAIQIEDRIDLLKEQRKQVKAIPEGQETPPAGATPNGPDRLDPVLQEWIKDGNQWFQDDPKLRDYSVALGNELIKTGAHEGKKGRAFLDLVATKMAEEFPRRFRSKDSAAAGAKPNHVEGGAGNPGASSGGGGGKAKTEANLPAEDLALMKQFIKEGWTTKEAFLKSYFSRNP